MINVYYIKDTDEVCIQIKDSHYFNEIREVFNQYHIDYDKEYKISYCNPKRFLDIEKALRDIEDVINISKEDREAISNFLVKPAKIQVFRKKLHPETWKFKPLDTYQKEAVKFLLTYEAGILNLPCGSGKTWILSTALDELLNDSTLDKILIISTRSSLYNWKRELLKFSSLLKEEEIQIISNEENRQIFEVYSDKKVIIIDYDTYKIVSEHYTALKTYTKKKLNSLNEKTIKKVRSSTKVRKTRIDFSKWNPNNKASMILDEIHKIKNNSARASHILASKDFFIRRYGASGTLLPRDYTDSYNPAKFLDKSIYFDYGKTDWEKDFCLYTNPNQKYTITGYDKHKLKVYEDRFYRYCFTRTEEECFKDKLPKYHVKRVFIPLTDEMRELYDDIVIKKFTEIEEEKGYLQTKVGLNNVFPYLMLMLSDINIIKNESIRDYFDIFNTWDIEKNPKYEMMLSIIEDHLEEDKDCKIAVGSYHPFVLDELSKRCKYKNIVLHGKNTNGKDKDIIRDKALEEFKKDKDSRIAFLQPSIFGESLTITEVNVHINWDNVFEFDKHHQFSRRFYRYSQTKETYRYDLVYDKSFEVIQYKVLDERFDLNRISNNFQMLSMQDWKRLKDGDESIIDVLQNRIIDREVL